MAQELVAVRMKHTIDQYPLVLELLMGRVYHLPRFYAEQLLGNDACESVQDTTPRLEAATLAGPRRRG